MAKFFLTLYFSEHVKIRQWNSLVTRIPLDTHQHVYYCINMHIIVKQGLNEVRYFDQGRSQRTS